MRYLRAKAIRKSLRQFHFLCGIKPPYKVLLDANFIAMCLQAKVDLKERIAKFLQVKQYQCSFYIPQSAINELEALGESMKQALEIAKLFQIIDPAEQKDGEINVSQDIVELVGERNASKYVVATQEVELRKQLRQIPGVPLIYLNRSVLVFENISRATTSIVRQAEENKMAQLEDDEIQCLEVAKNQDEDTRTYAALRKKRKAKGPNPLSCKKPSKKKVRVRKQNRNQDAQKEVLY